MKWTLILLLGGSLAETTLGWTYHYSNQTMNWTQARQWCQTHYTDMVVIQNQKENDYLVSLLPIKYKGPYFWIGITKKQKNDIWTWVGNNSTWIGERSWAVNEPNNNHSTEFCVEIYVNKGENRGKWNDEKCGNQKYTACYKAQCNATTCGKGRCQETIENITCLCDPGFEGDRCQSALSQPNAYHNCMGGNQTFNSSCQFKCNPGFLLISSPDVNCGINGTWSGPRPACASYKHALLAVAGCGAFTAFCCICFCWMKRQKRH
ncbi:hypothetical protein PAMP_024504 [Pampus punctatissimus]